MIDTVRLAMDQIAAHGTTLYAISRDYNIPYSTIKNEEKRGNQLSVDTIELLCNALGITIADFFSKSLYEDNSRAEN